MSNVKKLEKYQITIDGLKNTIDFNFDHYVILNEAERRLFSMASTLLSEELPAHRKKAIEDLIMAYRADYAAYKLVSGLGHVWDAYSKGLKKGE